MFGAMVDYRRAGSMANRSLALTSGIKCVTMRHMKTITIRELHSRTGQWVRKAAQHGQILVTDHGRTVARIVPEIKTAAVPYFARRKFISPVFRKIVESGSLGKGGTDSTILISEDREDRV
jgi:prevent-host-death family protein